MELFLVLVLFQLTGGGDFDAVLPDGSDTAAARLIRVVAAFSAHLVIEILKKGNMVSSEKGNMELNDLDSGMGGSNVLAGPDESIFSSGKRQEACKSEYLQIKTVREN